MIHRRFTGALAGILVVAATILTASGSASGAPILANGLDDPVYRVAGATRIATAIAVSQFSHPHPIQQKYVVLTRADRFPDNLAGTPLAAALDAPVLLTQPNSLDDATAAEIDRLIGPSGTIIILGGPEAIAPAIAAELAGKPLVQVVRLGGADRFQTAVLIAQYLEQLRGISRVLLATGTDFPDGLVAGAAAHKANGVVLLTNGSSMSSATAAFLSTHATTPITAVGALAAGAAPATAERIVGADRNETAALVATRFFPDPRGVGLATGADYTDALAGGADIAFLADGPILLVDPFAAALPPSTAAYLAARAAAIEFAIVYGGPDAVPTPLQDELQDLIT